MHPPVLPTEWCADLGDQKLTNEGGFEDMPCMLIG